jgi:DNA-binding transcriptional regulator YiaG
MTPENFKLARLHLGVSQTGLCALVGKCVRTIRSYESGKYPIPKSMELLIKHLVKQKDQSNDSK